MYGGRLRLLKNLMKINARKLKEDSFNGLYIKQWN